MAIIDLRNAIMTLVSGGSYLEIKIGEGNFTYNEKRNVELVKSRGKLDTARENEDEGIEVSFQFMWEHMLAGSGEPITIEDVLKNRAGWASTSPDMSAPFCVNVQIDYTPPCSGSQHETILIPMFHYLQLAHSIRDATVACSGIANAKAATVVRS